MKLTEERILAIIKAPIFDDNGIEQDGEHLAASAIYSAHEQEVKELREAFGVMIDAKAIWAEYASKQIQSLAAENALLKQGQKDFAVWHKKVRFIESEWGKVKDMNWHELYEYWKTINKNV